MKANDNAFKTIVFGCVFFINAAIAFRYFPITEGWWETYYWLSSNGLRLYKDLQLSHPPLHLAVYGYLLEVFDGKYFFLRLFGCFLSGAIALMEYIWLRNLLNARAALVGSTVATICVIVFNGAYVVRDYHSTVVLFEVIVLILTTPLFKNECNKKTAFLLSFFAGIAGGLLALTKQNLGVFFNVGIFASFVIIWFWFRSHKRSPPQLFLWAIAFAAGVMTTLVAALSVFGADWIAVYLNPGKMKGDITYVLTRFVRDKSLRTVPLISFEVVIIGLLCNRFNHLFVKKLCESFNFDNDVFCRISIVTFFSLAFLLFNLKVLSPSIYNLYFGIVLGILIFAFIESYFYVDSDKPDWIVGGLPIFITLAYAGTQTAGYNFVSMELLVAYSTAFVFCKYIRKNITDRELSFAVLLFTLIATTYKFTGQLYDWWGLKHGSGFSSKYTLKGSMFSGITVDRQTKEIFDVVNSWKDRLTNENTIFAYPNIPLLYQILNKLPTTRYPNLWFDVSQNSAASEVITSLESNLPDVVFWLKPPTFVYKGHIELTRQSPLMSEVDEFLLKKIVDGTYIIDSQHVLQTGDFEEQVKGLDAKFSAEIYSTAPEISKASDCFIDVAGLNPLISTGVVSRFIAEYESQSKFIGCSANKKIFIYKNAKFYNFVVLRKGHGL